MAGGQRQGRGAGAEGVIAELERGTFDDLGVSTLWLSPPYLNPEEAREGLDGQLYEGYHGYWVLDAREVDPRIGGEDALRIARLVEPACQEADRLRREELAARMAPPPRADVLVTGAAGFLGRALVAALRARGQRVRVLVRRSPPQAWTGDDGIDVVCGDLGDPGIVDLAVAGVATVFHVGAAMRGGAREFEAGTTWGTRNVVESCLRHGVSRLAYVSSLSVLDHAGRRADDVVQHLRPGDRFDHKDERRGSEMMNRIGVDEVVERARGALHSGHAAPAGAPRAGSSGDGPCSALSTGSSCGICWG